MRVTFNDDKNWNHFVEIKVFSCVTLEIHPRNLLKITNMR
jgi:hypothetical protein